LKDTDENKIDEETGTKSWGDRETEVVENETTEVKVTELKSKSSNETQREEREEREQREERPKSKYSEENKEKREIDYSKMPDEPPFVAYIGNISYNITKEEIASFFGDSDIKNIYLPTDREKQQNKGFGYVEFESKNALKDALSRNGETLKGRVLKVDISGKKPRPPRERSRFSNDNERERSRFSNDNERERKDIKKFDKTEADENNNWRKKPEGYTIPQPKEFTSQKPKEFSQKSRDYSRDSRDSRDYKSKNQRRPPQENIEETEETEQKERKKIVIAPRSISKPTNDVSESYTKTEKENPFGVGKAQEPKNEIEKKLKRKLKNRKMNLKKN